MQMIPSRNQYWSVPSYWFSKCKVMYTLEIIIEDSNYIKTNLECKYEEEELKIF